MIKRNYFKVVRVFPDPSDYFYIKNEGYDTGVLYFEEFQERTDIDFKIDNGSWTNLVNFGSSFIEIQPNSKLYLRGTTGYWKNNDDSGIYFYQNDEWPMSVGGDLRTLLDYTDVDSITTIPENCFKSTFQGLKIISIENLTLGSSVTTVGNNAFHQMFYGVSDITTGLDLSNVTTVGNGAMTYMYYQCTSLQKGSNLSGVTTVGDYAFNGMYQDCSSLNEAYAPNVSTWNTSNTTNWLVNVASTGVVYKPANLVINTNTDSGVPSGWTTQTYPQA